MSDVTQILNQIERGEPEAMRRLLVEQYRRKQRIKHGGGRQQVPLVEIVVDRPEDDLVALDESLIELAAEDALAAKVVELRYFTGLGHEQIAEFTGVTVYEARRKWTYARAWLREKLSTSN
jgi:RNA polymerase sigma factor (TIGR02999 family)